MVRRLGYQGDVDVSTFESLRREEATETRSDDHHTVTWSLLVVGMAASSGPQPCLQYRSCAGYPPYGGRTRPRGRLAGLEERAH